MCDSWKDIPTTIMLETNRKNKNYAKFQIIYGKEISYIISNQNITSMLPKQLMMFYWNNPGGKVTVTKQLMEQMSYMR
jgi:hypothetical protein